MGLVNRTIGDQLRINADTWPDRTAVIYCESEVEWTWSELNDQVNLLCSGLADIGVEKGSHVAMWGTNVPEWLLTQLAVGRLGAILVTINPEWKERELEYALQQSDTEVLVMIEGFEKKSTKQTYQYDYIDIIRKVCPEVNQSSGRNLKSAALPRLRQIILVGDRVEKGFLSWKEILGNRQSEIGKPGMESEDRFSADDTAMIQYTSGTTGFPKGTMLTHHNILNNALSSALNMDFTVEDRLCGPVPYYHCFGSILVNLCSLMTGATMVIPAHHFNASATLKAIQSRRCTALHGVPTMFIELLELPDFDSFDLSSLRTGIIAGAPVDEELMQSITEKMGASEITIGYGLTEASPITHQTLPQDPWEKRFRSVGRPIPHTQAKVVDLETHISLEAGEVGEIWVKGYHVMQGYYRNKEETVKNVVDGWLRTGDLGRTDPEGYYYIVGRLKEMIIVGGHNVYPAEVEQTLHTILADKVEMLQVVGVPHPKLQEVVALVVKCKPGFELDLDTVRAACKDEMEWPKIPRYVKIVDDFAPFMTVTGKLQKFKLAEFIIKEFRLETTQKHAIRNQ